MPDGSEKDHCYERTEGTSAMSNSFHLFEKTVFAPIILYFSFLNLWLCALVAAFLCLRAMVPISPQPVPAATGSFRYFDSSCITKIKNSAKRSSYQSLPLHMSEAKYFGDLLKVYEKNFRRSHATIARFHAFQIACN